MSFLYRVPEDGSTGTDGTIKIVDTEPVTVVSIGTMGTYGIRWYEQAAAKLRAWLDANPDWERSGDVRTFAYNGPEMPASRRWGEIQIPIRPVADAGDDEGASGADDPVD